MMITVINSQENNKRLSVSLLYFPRYTKHTHIHGYIFFLAYLTFHITYFLSSLLSFLVLFHFLHLCYCCCFCCLYLSQKKKKMLRISKIHTHTLIYCYYDYFSLSRSIYLISSGLCVSV